MVDAGGPRGGLEGYAVLVTGGGSGIGLACAARLAADRAVVTISGRREAALADAAEPIGATAGNGSFVGMSSLASHITHRWFGAYCVGKAGIDATMRNCADENGADGVRFNAIRPGFIATEIMEGIPRDSEVYRSYVENAPLGDVGQPDDVAQLARFLIGPESRWISGQCIDVDGGHGLRRGPDFSTFVG